MKRKIFIIGTGAIGKVLAVFLQAAGRETILINGRDLERADDALHLRISLPDESHIEATVRVLSLNALDTLDGVIVMANKSIGNSAVSGRLSGRCNDSPVVLLQNGLDIEQPLIEKGIPNIFRCVLYATSQPVGDTQLMFKPVAPSPIGHVRGDRNLLPEIISLLDTPQFRFTSGENIQTQ